MTRNNFLVTHFSIIFSTISIHFENTNNVRNQNNIEGKIIEFR